MSNSYNSCSYPWKHSNPSTYTIQLEFTQTAQYIESGNVSLNLNIKYPLCFKVQMSTFFKFLQNPGFTFLSNPTCYHFWAIADVRMNSSTAFLFPFCTLTASSHLVRIDGGMKSWTSAAPPWMRQKLCSMQYAHVSMVIFSGSWVSGLVKTFYLFFRRHQRHVQWCGGIHSDSCCTTSWVETCSTSWEMVSTYMIAMDMHNLPPSDT